MSRNIGPDERVKLLENLHGIYGTDFTHHVTDEEALEDLAKDNWCVRVKYPAKVECSKEELVCQFRKLWPMLNKEWVKKTKNVGTKEFWSEQIIG